MLPLIRKIAEDIASERKILAEVHNNFRGYPLSPEVQKHLGDAAEGARIKLRRYIAELNALGADIADSHCMGHQIEFPAEINGEHAYLCWSPDDGDAVCFWRKPNQPFSERRPLALTHT